MKIQYQSPNYTPEIITNRYLSIDSCTQKPIVDETVKTEHTNYIYRRFELPEEDKPRYSEAIRAAQERMHLFPNAVELKEN